MSYTDEIELDRRGGIVLARAVDALVARFGGTNVAAVKRIPGVSSGTLSKLRRPRIVSRWKAGTLDALARAAGVTRAALLAGKVAP